MALKGIVSYEYSYPFESILSCVLVRDYALPKSRQRQYFNQMSIYHSGQIDVKLKRVSAEMGAENGRIAYTGSVVSSLPFGKLHY